MKIKDVVDAMTLTAYIYGVVSQYKDELLDMEDAFEKLNRILRAELMAQLEELEKLEQPAPVPEEPAPVPEPIVTDCPTMPVQPIKPKPIEEIELTDKDIAANRKECQTCRYYSVGARVCGYIIATGKPLETTVRDCEHYKDTGKQRRIYKHTCKMCGAEFHDHSTRTKLCPDCKEVYA